MNVLSSKPWDANMGFAGFTGSGSSAGGYVRFGLRDMLNATNKTALMGVLNHIKSDINSSIEKVNDNAESAALYEMYKYFTAQAAFRGGYVSGQQPASNVDKDGNDGNPTGGTNKPTAYAQGLRSEFGLRPNGDYLGPVANSCGNNHVIFIVNNAQGLIPTGSQTFESVSAGDPLPALEGVSDVSWTDEWARFLYQNGITVHIMDAYNEQHNKSHSAVLYSAATAAGGMYFAVKNQAEIEIGFEKILAQIHAKNSNFAAASLPISATNRSQSLNQVFIGMFRPNTTAEPRWLGNLKQYQLIKTESGTIDLGDACHVTKESAVNLTTGFVTGMRRQPLDQRLRHLLERHARQCPLARRLYGLSTLNGVQGSEWSDMPDGPVVEKGGVAEVLRKGNNPSVTNASPTWTVSRSIQTYSTSTTSKLEPISTTNTGWSTTLLNWAKGEDDGTSVVVDDVTTYPYSDFVTPSETTRTRSVHPWRRDPLTPLAGELWHRDLRRDCLLRLQRRNVPCGRRGKRPGALGFRGARALQQVPAPARQLAVPEFPERARGPEPPAEGLFLRRFHRHLPERGQLQGLDLPEPKARWAHVVRVRRDQSGGPQAQVASRLPQSH